MKHVMLKILRIVEIYVIESSNPSLNANYFEVSFKRRRLPKTDPKAFATVDIILTRCGILSYLRAKQSSEISCKLIKNMEQIRMRANTNALSKAV